MDKTQILERLTGMLKDKFDIETAKLNGETRASEIGLDSITMVDLMLDLETSLDFEFETMDLPKNPSLGEIVDLIQQSMAKG